MQSYPYFKEHVVVWAFAKQRIMCKLSYLIPYINRIAIITRQMKLHMHVIKSFCCCQLCEIWLVKSEIQLVITSTTLQKFVKSAIIICIIELWIFSCDQAALRTLLSICLFVCWSVCLSHLFHNVPALVSPWNFQELLPLTKWCPRGQGQRSKVKVQFEFTNDFLYDAQSLT